MFAIREHVNWEFIKGHMSEKFSVSRVAVEKTNLAFLCIKEENNAFYRIFNH